VLKYFRTPGFASFRNSPINETRDSHGVRHCGRQHAVESSERADQGPRREQPQSGRPALCACATLVLPATERRAGREAPARCRELASAFSGRELRRT